MSIIWKYLDKRSATEAALKDYESMEFIIQNTAESSKTEREKMTGIASPRFEAMPRVHNTKAGEDRILAGIKEIDVLKERYRQAVEYMDWFQPAWDELSEAERFVLRTFYDTNVRQADAVHAICAQYQLERSSAYNKKNRALEHLQILLYGRD